MENIYAVVIHGGAGTILKSEMSPSLEQQYTETLQSVLDHSYKLLSDGGSALDVVELASVLLEDCPLFNAGLGSVYASDGSHELDASIMSGTDLKAGAVSLLKHVKNPIRLARNIMENSPHVYLSGQGAEDYATLQQIEMVDQSYFDTPHRYNQWLQIKETSDFTLDHTSFKNSKLGTIGAVALDKYGNLAAATSTGGMTNKRIGRIGDTAVIGSGTYAENGLAAISCTGSGEYFIRTVVAYDLIAKMKYAKMALREAAQETIFGKLLEIGGDGGLIAIDARGNIEMPFNTEGMYRGYKHSQIGNYIGIYGN